MAFYIGLRPKKRLIVKLIKDANSRPEPDWIPQPCTKKRQTLLSYEGADLELTAMEQHSDSEASQNLDWPKKRMGSHKKEELLPKKRFTNKNRMEVGRVPQADFNLLAKECKKAKELLFGQENTRHVEQESIGNQYDFLSEPIKKNGKASPKQPCTVVSENDEYGSKINIQSIKIANQRNTIPLVIQNSTPPAPQYSNLLTSCETIDYEDNGEFTCEVVTDNLAENSINDQITLAITNQNTMIQNQNLLLENQMRIIEQLANQDTMIQLICQQLSSTRIAASTSGASDIATETLDTSSDPLPIDSVAKLEQFEMDLRDETYMNKIIKLKSYICGTNGKLNGLNCSYKLIDSFFKRQLLLNYSWSGGSRNEEGKIAFKKYNNIMTTFYNIVRKADANYTEMECQNFFKSIIKNARRRFELADNITGKKRESSGKKRPPNLNYRIKKTRDEIQEHNQEHPPEANENNGGTKNSEIDVENEVTED